MSGLIPPLACKHHANTSRKLHTIRTLVFELKIVDIGFAFTLAINKL